MDDLRRHTARRCPTAPRASATACRLGPICPIDCKTLGGGGVAVEQKEDSKCEAGWWKLQNRQEKPNNSTTAGTTAATTNISAAPSSGSSARLYPHPHNPSYNSVPRLPRNSRVWPE